MQIVNNTTTSFDWTNSLILVDKPVSATPLEIIRLLKKHYSIPPQIKIGYAGRLDPQASGLLILLAGDAAKKRTQFEMRDKTYETELLCGISTDTYDIMGELTESKMIAHLEKKHIIKAAHSLIGSTTQLPPPYSSTRVKGKPLFYWTRKGLLHNITILGKKIEITSCSVSTINYIRLSDIYKDIIARIRSTHGSFRQEIICDQWAKIHSSAPNFHCVVVKMEIQCSHGTYIRSIAHGIGKSLNIPSLAYSIHRTRVGEFHLKDAIRLDSLGSSIKY